MTVSTEDLAMLVDTARGWVDENAAATPGLRRDSAAAAAQWREVAAMGWVSAAIDEAQGGAGFGYVGLGGLLDAIGREIADVPLASAAIAASAIARWGAPATTAEVLPALLAGERIVALALGEGAHHATIAAATAERTGEGWRLSGRKTWVHGAQAAGWFLVSAAADGESALFLVATTAVRLDPIASADDRDFAHVLLDGVTVADAARLAGPADLADTVLALGRLALAAEMVGATARALDITVDYLRTREQFGRRIGTFQALQHRAAQIHVDLELARSCVEAGWRAADLDDPQLAEHAIVAKAMAGDALHLASNEMIQMHGGIGMTTAHVAGSYIKWARVNEMLLGGQDQLADAFATCGGY